MAGAALSCALLAGVGFGFASAGSTPSADIDSFGIERQSASRSGSTDFDDGLSDASSSASSTLAAASTRDISAGIENIEAEEEAARKAAEEAARREEEERIAAAEAARAAQQAQARSSEAASALSTLSEVDWEVGKDAFLSEWSGRIDAYLAGSALAGYGYVFAEAAWENGVDPRFSPAISNTESSKGAICFKSHNAWGWGDSGWSSWDEAIRAHVAGLSDGYGYSITYSGAQKYCPPNYENWFNNTLSEMKSI